eukprot:8596717-Lingulodinium_polyedra.AAC.2
MQRVSAPRPLVNRPAGASFVEGASADRAETGYGGLIAIAAHRVVVPGRRRVSGRGNDSVTAPCWPRPLMGWQW